MDNLSLPITSSFLLNSDNSSYSSEDEDGGGGGGGGDNCTNSSEVIIPNITTSLICSSSTNSSPSFSEMPPHFSQMSDLSLHCVIAYCILFLISASGNISVFFSVLKQLRHTKNRISLLIFQLCISDLIVTFTAMPLEIVWRITIQWYGGDVLCKLCQFMRAFGLYLSSMVVICISLDRYFAIIYPLKLARAAERAKITLGIAWVVALMCAAPQTIIFHVEEHPKYPEFKQCVTESFLRSDMEQELVYNVFSVSVLYFVPLLIILFTYCRIVSKISHKSMSRGKAEPEVELPSMRRKQQQTSIGYHIHQNSRKPSVTIINGGSSGFHTEVDSPSRNGSATTTATRKCEALLSPMGGGNCGGGGGGGGNAESLQPQQSQAEDSTGSARKLFLRTSISGGVLMARARIRTLRLTCVIVLTFVFCWTPYVVMTLWYMIDREGAKSVDKRVQEGLFLMAVSNSVMNPLIYGTYGSSDCRSGSGHGSRRLGHYVTKKGNRNLSPSSQQRRSLAGGGAPTMTSVILTHHLTSGGGGNNNGNCVMAAGLTNGDRKTSVV